MFSNGFIHMTGCRSLKQARAAVNFLLQKVMEKAPAMRAKSDCMTQLRCFGLDDSSSIAILQSIRRLKNFSYHDDQRFQFNLQDDILITLLLHVDNESLFACRKVSKMFRNAVMSTRFWVKKTERELHCTINYNEQRKTWFMTRKYNTRFRRFESVKNAEHFTHPYHLYVRYSPVCMRRHKPYIVAEQYEDLKYKLESEKIDMINSNFSTGFDINLPVLFKILLQEYNKKRVTCTYNPEDYAAINMKYASPILHDNNCVIISIFIFRTGSIVINSAKTIEQQVDAYNFINTILRDNYSRIWNADSLTSNKKRKRN